MIDDPRDPAHITHTVEDVLQARIFAIACGYPDGNDLNWLRSDPAFKLACGRLPETGADLCSQPTISRWENAPTLREIERWPCVQTSSAASTQQAQTQPDGASMS